MMVVRLKTPQWRVCIVTIIRRKDENNGYADGIRFSQ